MKFRSKDGRIHNNRVSMLIANIKSRVSSRKSDEDEFLDFEEFDDDLFDEDDDDSDRSISEIDKNVLISSADQLSEMSRAADNIEEAKARHHIANLHIREPEEEDESKEAILLRQLRMDMYSAASIKDHDTAQKELDKVLAKLEKEHPEYISYAPDFQTIWATADEYLRANAKTAYDAEAVDKAINDQLNAAANAGIINPPNGSSATVTLEDGRKIELRNLQAVDDSTDILDEPIEDDSPIRVTEHPVEGMTDVSIFRGYANEDDPELAYKLARDAERERSMREEETNDSDDGEQL